MIYKISGRRLLGSLLSVAMLAIATPGFAENRAGALTLSPFAGGYRFDNAQRLEDSATYGMRTGYNFTENWSGEVTFGYVLAESKDPNYPETDAYSYGLDALYHFNPGGNFVPFLAAGAGGTTLVRPANGLSDNSDLLFNYGLGVKYFVSESVALRGDVRHVVIPNDTINNIVYTAGVTFLIGGEKPAVKPAPECPACVAPVTAKDTTAPYVTLVDPYNDSRDVPLHRELHVAFSEAMDPATINTNTFILQEGTSLVPGRVSAPANAPASFTQTSEFKPDTLYTGRITTGARDLAGNALKNDFIWKFRTAPTPEPVVITKVETKIKTKEVIVNKFVMLTGTHFAFDSSDLTPAGKELIKQNIKIMKDNPAIRVQIQGHSSAAGSEKYNQALSERRANSVRDYVINEGGIAPERLEAIGYGETRPAMNEVNPADHNSKEAKANMRVVFEIIEK